MALKTSTENNVDEATLLIEGMGISKKSFRGHFLYKSAKTQSNHCTLLCNLFDSDTDVDEFNTGDK